MATQQRLPLDRKLMHSTRNAIWTVLPLHFASRIGIRNPTSSFAERQIDETTTFVVPFSTVTVFDTTIFQTTFVTVHASSIESWTTSSRVRSSPASTSSRVSSSIAIRSSSLTNTRASLPSVLPGSSQPNLPAYTTSLEIPAVMTSSSTASEATAISIVGKDSERKSNKPAIMGGLSGAIAGLLVVGVIVCLLLRRRRKMLASQSGQEWATRDDTTHSYAAEKGFISTVIPSRPGTAMTRESPSQAFQVHPGIVPAVDEDHRMIRMSTVHWPRPFALGAGEGYRESVPAGQLRCTNPDLSRPGTPQTFSSSPQSFFGRKRSLLRGTPNSQPQQRHPLAQEIPTIKIVDPALSRERVSRYSNTPSFRSYRTMSTVQVVQQRTPDDPFLTPTAEEPVGRVESKQPSAARTISAASKAWTHILHPLRNRSNSCLEESMRASSHYSVDTTSSSARFSRRSDPFDLDRQSRNWNIDSEGRRSHIGKQKLYEGT